MVLGTGFLLLVSLVLSAFLNSVTQFASNYLALTSIMLEIVHTVFSFAMITLLFGLIFKIVPNVHIRWRDVWPAAFVTAILFTIGKFVLGLYLGRESVTSPYGAAGALVLVLLWSYYSAQILLFGAEFAQVYVRYRGSSVHPAKGFDFMTPLQIQDQPLTTQPGSRK